MSTVLHSLHSTIKLYDDYVCVCICIFEIVPIQGCKEGGFQRFQEPPVKFGLLSLQQEPNTLLSLATVSQLIVMTQHNNLL